MLYLFFATLNLNDNNNSILISLSKLAKLIPVLVSLLNPLFKEEDLLNKALSKLFTKSLSIEKTSSKSKKGR